MRIGLDLDGVIIDSIGRWIEVLNRGAGTNYGKDELPDTYGTPGLGAFCDRHELEMLIAPGPMPGAAETINRLQGAGHNLVVVTARAPHLRRLTEAWLDYHDIPVDRLHFLQGASKAPVARAEGLDLMVEDAPHNALALAEAGVPVLLFAAPYNREVRHPLVRRCSGWAHVAEQISRRSADWAAEKSG